MGCALDAAPTTCPSIANHPDFTPNPDRRHTRGRRGHSGNVPGYLQSEQAAFLEEAEDQDRQALRLSGVRKDRARRETADAKHHALRGLRGDFSKVTGEERKGKMVAAARRRRVALNLEGQSRQLTAFKRSEGLPVAPRRPVQPWNRPPKRPVKAPVKTSVLAVRTVVQRFKRTGDLPVFHGPAPDYVAWLGTQDQTGVDGKTLRRMIQALLHRGGVEEDPGPAGPEPFLPWTRRAALAFVLDTLVLEEGFDLTHLQGAHIINWLTGRVALDPALLPAGLLETLLLRAGIEPNPGPPPSPLPSSTSPDCSGLDALTEGGLSPDRCPNAGLQIKGEYFRAHGHKRLMCPQCSATLDVKGSRHGMGRHPGVFTPPLSEPGTAASASAPAEAPAPPPHPRLHITRPVRPGHAAIPAPVAGPPAPEVPTSDSPSSGDDEQPASSSPSLPLPTPCAVGPKPAPVLAGHTLEEKEYQKIAKRACIRHKSSITYSLLSPFTDAGSHTVTRYSVPYQGERRLATSRNITEIKENLEVVVLKVFAEPAGIQLAKMLAMLTLVMWPVGFSVLCATDMVIPPVLNFFLHAFLFVFWGTALLLYISPQTTEVRVVSWIPHLVSCVLSEYERGVSPEVARATMRQKIRRLACLPIPDFDYLRLVEGSELVIEVLMKSGDFFGEGPTCVDGVRGQVL